AEMSWPELWQAFSGQKGPRAQMSAGLLLQRRMLETISRYSPLSWDPSKQARKSFSSSLAGIIRWLACP
ncbi:MAG: hypothetical protein EDX89_24590, partial [Acidobacteria bacterium]